MRFVYKGFTTHTLYRYAAKQSENAMGQISVNGETAQRVNSDGAIQRGYAAKSPTIYDAGATYSPWEQH